MKTREEVIKEAFDNGWNSYHELATRFDYTNSLDSCLRDLEETNNGWIKIESEEDLPKKNTKADIIINEKTYQYCDYRGNNIWYNYQYKTLLENATHYQSVIKPKKPLY